MTDQRVLPKILRLRAERIAGVHFDEIYATDNPDVVQGKLPDGKYVVVDLIAKKVITVPVSYEQELQKKVDAGIIASEPTIQGNYDAAVTRESIESTQPVKTTKKKVSKKITTVRKSSRK